MSKWVNRLWGACLLLAFHTARIVFSITKYPVRGTMVAIWHRGRILLVKSSYRKVWSVPGGLVKKGEAWERAAVRETFEEVGLRLREEDLIFKAEVPGDLGPNDRSHLFEVKVDGPVAITVDGREIIFAEFVPPEEALKRALHGNVRRYLEGRDAAM